MSGQSHYGVRGSDNTPDSPLTASLCPRMSRYMCPLPLPGKWYPECQGKNWDGLYQPKDYGGIQDITLPHAQKVVKEDSTFQAHWSNGMSHNAKPINTKWSSILCIIDIQITAVPLAQRTKKVTEDISSHSNDKERPVNP